MLTYNNNHIFTGYIKQLLANFNLPKYRIYTHEDQLYHDEMVKYLSEHPEIKTIRTEAPNIIETVEKAGEPIHLDEHDFSTFQKHVYYANYIKDNKVQRYICTYNDQNELIKEQWKVVPQHFHYNKKTLNHTKNLVLKNNIYDSYTHEYLGDYLRFIRDYHNINLMPLYNCFSNTLCPNLHISFDYQYKNEAVPVQNSSTSKTIEFNSADGNYKIYMLPVKLFKSYTIAVDSDFPIEICCGFYGKYFDTREKVNSLTKLSYRCYTNCKFNTPILYDGISADSISNLMNLYSEFSQIEDTLKMFIKLPFNNQSTITILEGDYRHYNQKSSYDVYTIPTNSYDIPALIARKIISNKAIINWDTEAIGKDKAGYVVITKFPQVEDREFDPITNLQLLSINTHTQHPFADRLIEYLTGNVISPLSDIIDNIKRAQTVMLENNDEHDNIKFSTYGAWDEKMRLLAYEYMNTTHPNTGLFGIPQAYLHDCLGYIDKDVEKFYTSYGYVNKTDRDGNIIYDSTTGQPVKVKVSKNTILGVDLYSDLYK